MNHTTATQSNLATLYAAGAVLSDGGGIRLFTNPNGHIEVKNCYLEWTLRGIRCENASSGIVSNNTLRYVADNGIYIRNSSKFLVTSNNLFNMGHVGLQTIYSTDTAFINNNIHTTWGNGYTDYGSVNSVLNNNTFMNCCI